MPGTSGSHGIRTRNSKVLAKAASMRTPTKAFRGKAIAFRPTTQDGVFDVVFQTQAIATIDIRPLDCRPGSVHDVSEHLSTLSPV